MNHELPANTPGKLFEIRSDGMERGSWWVVILPPGFDDSQEVTIDDMIACFHAGGSLAEDWMGSQIAKDLLTKGFNVGLVFHTDEEFGQDIEEGDE